MCRGAQPHWQRVPESELLGCERLSGLLVQTNRRIVVVSERVVSDVKHGSQERLNGQSFLAMVLTDENRGQWSVVYCLEYRESQDEMDQLHLH